jgi:polysaccharide biosynthesis/export protein
MECYSDIVPLLTQSRLKMLSVNRVVRAVCAIVICICFSLSASAQSSNEYELGGGDSVKISVFLSPELTTEVRISESGAVSLPMVGKLQLGGLTIPQAEALLESKLKDGNFIQKPQVTMAVINFRSQQVSILGNVGKPGRYPLEVKGMRLTDLLANAGGVTSVGSDSLIHTRREANGKVVTKEIDLPSIYLNNDQSQDLVLQGGDSVYVHRQPNYYIYGQVGRPGSYVIERGLTVSQAIAKGGSYTLRSRESGVRLLRRDASGRMIELTPKMDDLIKPDDQIFIRESLF